MANSQKIENYIADMEKELPLEVRVAISYRRHSYPMGAVRFIAVTLLVALILTEFLWLPLFWWFFAILLIPVLMKQNVLGKFPFASWFSFKEEREKILEDEAQKCFRELKLGATTHRSGVLLYFYLPGKQFFLLPDLALQQYLPEDLWKNYASQLNEKLNQKAPIEDAVVAVLQALRTDATGKLPAQNLSKRNELSNEVLILR